jgi:hypothetical protein
MVMAGRETKYIVIPKGTFTISSLGEFLNTFYSTDGQETFVKNGTVIKNGFYIPHAVITTATAMFPDDLSQRMEFYSQEGEGKVRPYCIPSRKKSAEEKRVDVELEKLKTKKNAK